MILFALCFFFAHVHDVLSLWLLQEGVELLRSTLEPKAEVFGEFSPEVAETLKLIGSVQLSQGDAGKALKTLKKVWVCTCACVCERDRDRAVRACVVTACAPSMRVRSPLQCHDMETLVYGANSKKSRDTQKTIDLLLA